jgi:hypothetical protein
VADVERYRGLLRAIEDEAREQSWARERPWRADSHVAAEGGVVVVDLHDLRAGLARRAVREVLQHPSDTGAVVFVHGRERHTLGPTNVLRKVVTKELRRACLEQSAWSYRPLGPARVAWISDRDRAPRAVTGGGGWGLWILLLLLLLAFLLAVANAIGWLG